MMRSLWTWLSFLVVATSWLPSQVAAATGAKPLTVQTGIMLRELRVSESEPDTFRANFLIWHLWKSDPGQNWSPDQLIYTNALGSPTLKVPLWTRPKGLSPGMQFKAMIYEGEFKAFNRYQAYPLDQHFLEFRMVCPQSRCGEVRLISSPDQITLDQSIPDILRGWTITGAGFGTRQLRVPEDLHLKRTLNLPTAETTVYSFVVRIKRDLSVGLLLIFVPMLLIWFLAYIGLYWDDSSPASRYGSTALFVAIAFNLAARSLQPAVNYVTLMNLAFLGLYINILAIVVLTTLSFYFRSRKGNYRRIVAIGRRLPPLLLGVTILLLFPLSRLSQDAYSERPMKQMQFQEWQPSS